MSVRKMKPIEALELLQPFKTNEDVVYEMIKRKKRSFITNVITTILPELYTGDLLVNDKIVYLIANKKEGKIIEFNDKKVSNITNIPNWVLGDKKPKYKTILDGYMYLRLTKIS